MTNRSSLPHTAYPSSRVSHDKEYFMRPTDAPDGLSSKHTESVSRVLLTAARKRVHAQALFYDTDDCVRRTWARGNHVDLFVLGHGPGFPTLMTTMIRPPLYCRSFLNVCVSSRFAIISRGLTIALLPNKITQTVG